MGNPRQTAVEALCILHGQEGYSNLVLDRLMDKADLSARDKTLAAALFYGVLERQITVDYILEKFLNQSISRLPPQVTEILRTGLYQIYFMSRIPASAAVDEAVKLSKATGQNAHAALINGVLRTADRERKKLRYPDEKTAPLRFLEVKYSCPAELISFWRDSYGEANGEGLLKSALGRPPLTIRVNTMKTTPECLIQKLSEEGIQAARSPVLVNALVLTDTAAINRTDAYRAGLFHVQDLASQLCCEVLDPQPGEIIYDICAAPGGKSFTMAEKMGNIGTLLAFDQYDQKVTVLSEGAGRLGLSCMKAKKRDARRDTEALPRADRILCDLPCSGLGTIRRKPEIRYKSLSNFDDLPALQLSILQTTAPLLKPGGRLVYSTCTLSPRENSDVAQAFLLAHPDYESEPIRCPNGLEHAIEEPAGEWTLFPHVHGTDGFFMASFRKKDE